VCQLHAPADQKGAGANENRVRPLGCKRCECGGDLSAAAGVDNPDLQSHGASGRLHVSYRGLGHCSFGRIDEYGHTGRSGHQLTQQLKPLCCQLDAEKVDTGQVAVRSGEARDQTKLDRIFANDEDDRDLRGCRLGRGRRRHPSGRSDRSGLAANQFGCKRRQSIDLIVGHR
jgi:hypothetical protein